VRREENWTCAGRGPPNILLHCKKEVELWLGLLGLGFCRHRKNSGQSQLDEVGTIAFRAF